MAPFSAFGGRWFYQSELFEDESYQLYQWCSEKHQNQENDEYPIFDGHLFTLVYRLDARTSGLKLIIHCLRDIQYSEVSLIQPHVLHDARPGNVIRLDIRQVTFQSFARGNKIASVVYGNDNNQPSVFTLFANAIFVTHILSHTESIATLDVIDDDENRLDPTFMVQLAEIVVR
jgi:hypothetical protein